MHPEFLDMLNIELPCDPAILLLEKWYVLTETCKWMFIAALFIIAKKVETIQMSTTDELMNKK